MLTVGSLFSGIGGFDKGLEDTGGFKVVWQVENNEYARKVLAKHWSEVPCHYDITTIDWRDIPAVDLVCGGFPCQPFSCAGKRGGKADDRYLWPEVVRCLDTLQPTWFLGENVPGIINMALDQVCTDLEGLGYHVWTVCVPACAVDAPHIRQRIWIVAHAECDGRRSRRSECERQQRRAAFISASDVADTECQGSQGHGQEHELGEGGTEIETRRGGDVANAYGQQARRTPEPRSQHREWVPEPNVGRVAHGVPRRVDRLKGLGNAVVPQVVEALGRLILAAHATAAPRTP